jgi:hypothetical protein
MTDLASLRASIEAEISDYTEYLRRLRPLVDLVPVVSDRLEDAEAKLVIIDNAPEDFVQEIAPRLIAIQEEDDSARSTWLPVLPETTYVSSAQLSTGTSSDFYEATISSFSVEEVKAEWLQPIADAYFAVANERARSSESNDLAATVHPDLASEYVLTLSSVDKARQRIIGVDQALIRMRDFIEGLWGGLGLHARRSPIVTDWPSSLKLRNEAHRAQVSSALGGPKRATLNRWLDDLSVLHSTLSTPSKDMLSGDTTALDILFTRWALLVHEILVLVRHATGAEPGGA